MPPEESALYKHLSFACANGPALMGVLRRLFNFLQICSFLLRGMTQALRGSVCLCIRTPLRAPGSTPFASRSFPFLFPASVLRFYTCLLIGLRAGSLAWRLLSKSAAFSLPHRRRSKVLHAVLFQFFSFFIEVVSGGIFPPFCLARVRHSEWSGVPQRKNVAPSR